MCVMADMIGNREALDGIYVEAIHVISSTRSCLTSMLSGYSVNAELEAD